MKSKINTTTSNLKQSVRFIRSKTSLRPKIAIIFGSGLGDFAEGLNTNTVIDSKTIPHYPKSTVEGHRGKLIFGKMGKTPIIGFQGRVHFYETGKLETVLYPILVAHQLGVKTLIVTNAAGGINSAMTPGDLMLITDQINLTFENAFKDSPTKKTSKKVYDHKLNEIILKIAEKKSIELKQGVYCGLKGPSYETAAEIRMLKKIGADAVGMSTVNETSLAVSLGMRVAGISCITNLATGGSKEKLSHAEVTEVAQMAKQSFTELLAGLIEKLK